MRINKYIAQHTGLSRRTADQAIAEGRIAVNGLSPKPGQQVMPEDTVTLDNRVLADTAPIMTIMLNKPAGYVCSREGQGSRTIYDLIPERYRLLNSVGRLDKQSSGIILLTNDGQLANQLTHPRFKKNKLYQVKIDKPLAPLHHQMISDHGLQLDDGPSKLALMKLDEAGLLWQVTMNEGRNRQIRRTFNALGYEVTMLHRTQFGSYQLANLAAGQIQVVAK